MNKENQIALIRGESLTKRDIMDAVDAVLSNLNQSGDFDTAIKVVNTLDNFDNITGHAKAKLLWGMSRWYKTQKNDTDFENYIESNTSTRKITAQRYINVWEHIEQENIPKAVQKMPMRELIPVAIMLTQGYEPTKEQWKQIELAANPSDLGNIINEIKGKKSRKSKRDNVMEEDGSIYTWKNNVRKYVGFLDVNEAKTDPDVAEAIDQIIAGRPITRR